MNRPYRKLTDRELDFEVNRLRLIIHDPKSEQFYRNFSFNRLTEVLAEMDIRDRERVQESF